MATVSLAFSPAAEFVRTARLVSVAVARRAGVSDEFLDEVGLAVGDACGRAVARHLRHAVAELVQVVMTDDGPYVVRVIDACRSELSTSRSDPEVEDPADAEEADRMADALLAGLVEDLDVRTGEAGREVRMAWPVRRRLGGGAVV